jgi:redox-sensitive bicupin YhaK (pirin superfamily)
MLKKIANIFNRPAQPGMVGDGFRVFNYYPSGYAIRNYVDPFLMLDFGASHYFPPSEKVRGVDVHPHRGFETVTIALKGAVAHHDSAGNSGIIYPGDVQWMTAGSGILHKEYHEENFSKQGGDFEMIQLWVNLPKTHKMTSPNYQEITNKNIPKFISENKEIKVEIIAGNFNGTQGIANTFTPINLFLIDLMPNSSITFKVPETHNSSLLLISGELNVNENKTLLHNFVLFENNGEEINLNTEKQSKVLFLSGEPINEPIAQYGPFVMNTQQEILQAFDDYNNGKFGVLN